LTGGPANKYTAQVNEATLGTQEHDLSHLVTNFDKVAAALTRNDPELRSLVVNFRRVTGDFAVQSQALQSAVHQLPGVLQAAQPVFTNLNASFPFVRAFAREALPGVRSSGPALTAATPYIAQLRGLVSKPELRGLTHDLTGTVPQLALLTKRQIPFMEQARALASCFNHVIIPWSNSSVQNSAEGAAGKVYQETSYGLVGIGGESRQGDANGQTIKVMAGGGPNTLLPLGAVGAPSFTTIPGTNNSVGVISYKIIGSEPNISDSPKTPFKPSVPCETQQPPNLGTSTGPAPAGQVTNRASALAPFAAQFRNSEAGKLSIQGMHIYELALKAQQAEGTGNTALADKYAQQYLTEARAYYSSGKAQAYLDAIQKFTGHKLSSSFIKTQLGGWQNVPTAIKGAENLLFNKPSSSGGGK
jgi:phospholipid/cholesterol/gamma-HCH transport system substrate-binding protein